MHPFVQSIGMLGWARIVHPIFIGVIIIPHPNAKVNFASINAAFSATRKYCVRQKERT